MPKSRLGNKIKSAARRSLKGSEIANAILPHDRRQQESVAEIVSEYIIYPRTQAVLIMNAPFSCCSCDLVSRHLVRE
jgi:hypothetical protein